MTRPISPIKPIRLVPEVTLTNSDPSENQVIIKNQKSEKKTNQQKPQEKHKPINILGKVDVRQESKGRGGKPVFILFRFADPAALDEANLKALCISLKNQLAAGGTVENKEIILQCRDTARLKNTLIQCGLTPRFV